MKKHLIYQITIGSIYIFLLLAYGYLSLQTGSDSAEQSKDVVGSMAAILQFIFGSDIVVDGAFVTFIRKLVGHYIYFVGLGLFSWLFYYSFKNIKLWKRLVIHFSSGLIYSFITEFVFQIMMQDRNPTWGDVFLDFGGFITVSLILTIVVIIKESKFYNRKYL